MSHNLNKINALSISEGEFSLATLADLEIIANYTIAFEKDIKTLNVRDIETVRLHNQKSIENKTIYKWVVDNNIVSIAAIVRETKNIGIVGLVYTPNEYRGKGYARSCTLKLSEKILNTGFKYCGLFTDKANPTSNKIYKEIGYEPVSEFLEIEYN